LFSTLAAYGLIGCFLGMERLARQGKKAKSLEFGPFDRGSTRLLGVAYLAAIVTLVLAPVLSAFQIGALDCILVGWAGIGLMLGGMALRFWANQVLGQLYTRTLCVAEDQPVIDHGPYKLLRHPGYSGMLLLWAGAGLATLNWTVASAVIVEMVGAYCYRIRCEEQMLQTVLEQRYESYRGHTWKLVPFVY
jgi:protein-S-isoprenylcysteine O-methyltransferase